jgi:hypothetical protein
MKRGHGMTAFEKVLVGCGGLFFAFIVIGIGLLIWLSGGRESGVKYANEMDKYALTYLSDHKILIPSEELIAYYDITLKMDGTEAAILTTKRVIYHKADTNTVMKLADVTNVTHRKETLIGDLIDVMGPSGKIIHIEVAPLNDGDKFLTALMGAWKHENPKASKK